MRIAIGLLLFVSLFANYVLYHDLEISSRRSEASYKLSREYSRALERIEYEKRLK